MPLVRRGWFPNLRMRISTTDTIYAATIHVGTASPGCPAAQVYRAADRRLTGRDRTT